MCLFVFFESRKLDRLQRDDFGRKIVMDRERNMQCILIGGSLHEDVEDGMISYRGNETSGQERGRMMAVKF